MSASNRSRGTEKERQIEKLLTALGWKIHRAHATSKRLPNGHYVVNSNDLWGSIDIAAVRAGSKTLLIQATASKGSSRRAKVRKELGPFIESAHVDVQVWEWARWGPEMCWRIWVLAADLSWKDVGYVNRRGTLKTSDPTLFSVFRPAAVGASA